MVALAVLLAAGGLVAYLVISQGGGPDDPPVEEPRGIVFGSIETVDGQGVGGAEVVVTPAGAQGQGQGRELGRALSDELGLFEVDLGNHEGPVVVQATRQADSAATVVAATPDGATTGVRLRIGPAGTGTVDGRVTTADGSPLDGGGVAEARFVETGRSAVVGFGPDGTFRFEGLPLDGDLVVMATSGQGDRQGLASIVVSESVPTNTAEIALGAGVSQTEVARAQQPEIVTEDLGDWRIDGPVTVVPTDQLG